MLIWLEVSRKRCHFLKFFFTFYGVYVRAVRVLSMDVKVPRTQGKKSGDRRLQPKMAGCTGPGASLVHSGRIECRP